MAQRIGFSIEKDENTGDVVLKVWERANLAIEVRLEPSQAQDIGNLLEMMAGEYRPGAGFADDDVVDFRDGGDNLHRVTGKEFGASVSQWIYAGPDAIVRVSRAIDLPTLIS